MVPLPSPQEAWMCIAIDTGREAAPFVVASAARARGWGPSERRPAPMAATAAAVFNTWRRDIELIVLQPSAKLP
ncbi:hypothetical protein AB0M44_48465 [Streptosporangium subroseum]